MRILGLSKFAPPSLLQSLKSLSVIEKLLPPSHCASNPPPTICFAKDKLKEKNNAISTINLKTDAIYNY